VAQVIINELSSLFLTFSFTDEIGDPVVPNSIDWRVDNVNDPHAPVEVLDWASVAVPASAVSVQIPGASNSISDATKNKEKRLVTVRMNSALSTQAFDDKPYIIRNLHATP